MFFNKSAPNQATTVAHLENVAKHTSSADLVAVPLHQTMSLPEPQPEQRQYTTSSTIPHTRSASILSDQVSSEDVEIIEGNSLAADEVTVEDSIDDETAEAWEDELMLSESGDISRFCNWSELRKKIKSDLRKNSKSLSLGHINKLNILSNFATLCIKGCSRMQASNEIARQWHEGKGVHFARQVRALARHYQIFAQLPIERRGGKANAHSWLNDKTVQSRT